MRKGFTLIELLGAICILAILSIIAVSVVINIMDSVNKAAEERNFKTLLKIVNDYTTVDEMENVETEEAQFFVIKDDVEYTIDKKGNRTKTNKLQYKGKVCDYCIIKINNDKKISILYEGKNQDLIKDYDSKQLKEVPLIESREVMSFYNELVLLKDIYIANNKLDSIKYLKSNDNILYEINQNGEETKTLNLNNSTGKSRMRIVDSSNYTISIVNGDEIIEFRSNGEIVKSDIVNEEYSDKVNHLYDELKFYINKYIDENTISNETYYEFNNGVINKVDNYGNVVATNVIPMQTGFKSRGEIKINSDEDFSLVIYDDKKNIRSNYGSEKLYDEVLNYVTDSYILFKNLGRLELLAEEYLNGSNSSTYKPTKSDWLVFYYIRSLKYNSTTYDIVTGSDDGFANYVSEKAPALVTYFTNFTSYFPNGENVDLKHLAAALAGKMYDTPAIYNLVYEELEYDIVVSWGGDLHQIMARHILKSSAKQTYGSYYNATYNLMGVAGKSFGMDDVHSDIDAWLLYYNFIENPNLSVQEIFHEYYSGNATRSSRNRYSSFITIMNDIADDFNTNYGDFAGVARHFADVDQNWQNMETLEITPTEDEEQEISSAFVKWIEDQVAKE